MYTKLNAKQQAKASSASRLATVYTLRAQLGAGSEIRCYQAGTPIFARATLEYPGEFARWEFQPAGGEDGVFTIKNVGLDRFVVADEDGTLIVADRTGATPAEFRVQPAEDGFVLIKQRNADKVWGLLGGSPVYAEIGLQAADGSREQMFSQVAADE